MNTRPALRRSARPSAFLLGLGAAATLAAACGSGSGGTTSTAATGGGVTPTGGATGGQAAVLTMHATSLGPVLVGPDGRTVYLFEKDKGTTSSCSGACLGVWPAVTTTGAPAAGGTVQKALLGTTSGTDGSTQVTYAGHPLYYFAGDRAPGDVHGEGLKSFGAGWYVLKADGQKIDKD